MTVAFDVVATAQSTNLRNRADADAAAGRSCSQKVNNEFRGMKKSRKIIVNGREIGFYGFDNSAEHLIELDMSKTGIVIPIHNTSFQNLMILKASFNNYRRVIDGVGNETFPSLRILNFSHNALDSFNPSFLEHMKEIEILDLSYNCIEHIHSSTMLRHRNVREIHLQHNRIKSFKLWPSHVEPGMQLNVLDISHNEMIEYFDPKIIIEYLNVAHNKLSSLKIHHASKMNVDASFNQLKTFGERKETTYHLLNLSHNSFESLNELTFKVATTLDLSHNQCGISEAEENSNDIIEDDEFESKDETIESNRISVVNLNLSFNSLRKLSEISDHFDVKKILFLDNNRLSGIDFEHFKRAFPTVQRVSLSANPLTRADENELKYHNNTQLLSIHFGYDFRTKAPPAATSSSTSTRATSTTVSTTTNKHESEEENKTKPEKSTSLDCSAAKVVKSIQLMATDPPASAETTSKSTANVGESRATSVLLFAVVALMFIVMLLLVIFAKSTIRNPHARLIETTNEFENVRIGY